MVKITGAGNDRAAARDVAEWCARELATARQTGHLETRPFVQNVDIIIAALREFSRRQMDFGEARHAFESKIETAIEEAAYKDGLSFEDISTLLATIRRRHEAGSGA